MMFEKLKRRLLLIFWVYVVFNASAALQSLVAAPVEKKPKINVCFVFHINQDLTPSVYLADVSGYSGLIRTLLKHPKSSFTLHISGPTIVGLQWLDPQLIYLMREGVKSKHLELLGSTYAQNVMYSTHSSNDPMDMTDNIEQIRFHRLIIERVFGIKPIGFWNAERVWRQDFVKYIKQFGYEYTFIQDHIQLASGVKDEYTPKRTGYGSDTITIIGDDVQFKDLVNNVIDGKRAPDDVIQYLKHLTGKPNSENFLVVYAEDAEATGFWDFEREGKDPRLNWENLDKLLTALEQTGFVNIVTPSQFLAKFPKENYEPVKKFSFGAADWMEKASRREGYGSWAKFNAVYEPNKKMRALYDVIRQKRLYVENLLSQRADTAGFPGLAKLVDYSKFLLAAHQFELGSNDNVYSGEAEWERSRVALVPLYAVEYFLEKRFGVFETDVNYDGVKEIIANNPRYFVVFSQLGGKILYWYDYEKGVSLLGTELGTYYKEHFIDDNHTLPRLKVFAPLWGYIKGKEDVYPFERIKDKHFFLRTHTLLDEFFIGDVLQGDIKNAEYNYEIMSPNRVRFKYISKRFSFTKSYMVDTAGISVSYEVLNRTKKLLKMRFMPIFNIVPDVFSSIYGGKDSILLRLTELDRIEWVNVLNNYAVYLDVSRYRKGLYYEKSLLTVPIQLKYEFSLPPRFRKFFKFRFYTGEDTVLTTDIGLPRTYLSCFLNKSDSTAILLNGKKVILTETGPILPEALPEYTYSPLPLKETKSETILMTGSDILSDELLEYPLNPVFEPGCFDLQKGGIYETDNHYVLEVSINAPFSNVWNGPFNLSVQGFDFYFSSNEGGTVPLPGREFPESFQWQYMARLEGWYPEIRRDDGTRFPIDYILTRGTQLKAYINKDFLDIAPSDKTIVFSYGQSDEVSNQAYRIRRYGKNAEWNFAQKEGVSPLGYVVDWMMLKKVASEGNNE